MVLGELNTVLKPEHVPEPIPEPIPEPVENPRPESKVDSSICPLKAFAQENGRKQLCKAASTDGELTRYLLFTKETKVLMSADTEDYSASDIKERKDNLAIHKYEDGRYVLELTENIGYKNG